MTNHDLDRAAHYLFALLCTRGGSQDVRNLRMWTFRRRIALKPILAAGMFMSMRDYSDPNAKRKLSHYVLAKRWLSQNRVDRAFLHFTTVQKINS